MPTVQKILRRLFFYSSRQLSRRRRSYLSIFLTSVVLLTLVMTFLEMMESFYLRTLEIAENGYHHLLIREITTDFSEDIEEDSRIDRAWAIPYTSLMASSDDASAPARVVVPTEEIYEHLGVRYVWGQAPGDGEIAVSTELYNAYAYLTAGEENELYFKATEMTYFPLTVSGIFETNDNDAGYVFVTKSTADAIDKETRAKTKYDLYIRAKYASDRNIALIIHDIFTEFRLPDTQWQTREPLKKNAMTTIYTQYLQRYDAYINYEYLHEVQFQSAAPLIAVSMPVIAIAALMMASFMSNWVTSNSEEYGILGAIGANRRQICTISAGQILLIGLVAAIPVVLLSAAISNIYISTFNSASGTDVDYIFAVPWLKLIEAALWWCVLSCFFTYIGIARITMELPFVLISGQGKYRIPYVARSSPKLMKAKDKILSLSLLKARRVLKSRIPMAFITSLICIVCGVFVTILILYRGAASSSIADYDKYTADLFVSEKEEFNSYGRDVPLNEELAGKLAENPLIEKVGLYDAISAGEYEQGAERRMMELGDTLYQHYPYIAHENASDGYMAESVVTLDRTAMDMASFAVLDGDPYRIFEDPACMVAVVSGYEGTPIHVGDKFTVYGTQKIVMRQGTSQFGDKYTYRDVYQTDNFEYTVCAVVIPVEEFKDLRLVSGVYIMSDEGRRLCGLEGGCWSKILGWFKDGASKEELRSIYENLVLSPDFLRYDITTSTVQSEYEERVQLATTIMLCFFFSMLYLAFCTTTYTDSFLKVTKERREIAILRQIGADDKDIHRSMRAETYPTVVLALCITLAAALLIPTVYVMVEVARTRAVADYAKFPPEVTERLVEEIIQTGLILYALFLPSIPMHLISAGVTALGTRIPTKRILNDTIAEGIRKDTD